MNPSAPLLLGAEIKKQLKRNKKINQNKVLSNIQWNLQHIFIFCQFFSAEGTEAACRRRSAGASE